MAFPLGFNNGAFLVGLAAAAIPVIVHLIYRRRAPRVMFSTLRFLLLSARRTARRRRLQNLLVLALRMAMVALIALACAGPFLKSGVFGAAGAGGAVAILLDNSLSMTARQQGTQCYDLAKEMAGQVLSGLGERDLCAVLLAPGRPTDEPPHLTNNIEELRNRIATSEPVATSADLTAAIERASRMLAEAGFARRELYVLTDMQALSWEGAPTAPLGSTPPVPVVLLDCSRTEVRNIALADVSVVGQAMVVGAPLTVQATVHNRTPHHEEEVVDMLVGGEKRGSRTVTLAPYEEKPVQFTMSLDQPGFSSGQLQLQGDDLSGDDVAYFTVQLSGPVSVLLAKESAHPISFLDDTFFLARALNPLTGQEAASPTGITVEEALLEQVDAERLRRFPVTFLVNVGNLSADQVKMLRDYVAAGNALTIFLGERVQAEGANQLLGETPSGEPSLLPAVLGAPRGNAESQATFFALESSPEEHPLFSPFRTSPVEFFSQVHVYRFFPVTVPAGGGRVLAWLRGTSGDRHPFLVEKQYGRGRCLLVVTSATASWSNFPVTSLFLPLMTTAVHYLVGEARQTAALTPGVPKRFLFPTTQGPVSVEVTDPTGRTTRVNDETGTRELVFPDTYQVGVYRYQTTGPSPESGCFAVNPQPEESDLRRIEVAALAQRFPQFAFHLANSPAELDKVMARLHQPYQLGTFFFWALLLVAAVEGLLANRVSANLQTDKERK
jgi:hypothetical protein